VAGIPRHGVKPETGSMSDPENFVIRRSDRHEIMLPVRLRVHEPDRAQVRLSSRSGQREGWVTADLVDLASGGMGVVSPVYLPRGCLADVQLLPFAGDSATPLLEMRARVRRVVMTDRRPAYLVGLLFVEPTDAQAAQLKGLLAQISGEAESPTPGGVHVRNQ
jgi:hypothetical protein